MKKLPGKNLGPNAVRIIAGAWRGRKIQALPGETVRPTADRVREALFNRLTHGFAQMAFQIQGARVLDVFAGTGALGLEALSRGAKYATFVEKNPDTASLIRRNSEKLGAEDRGNVLIADAAHLPSATDTYDLALLDPPYGQNLAAQTLTCLILQGWLKPGALVSVETDATENVSTVSAMVQLDRRSYGRAVVSIFHYRP